MFNAAHDSRQGCRSTQWVFTYTQHLFNIWMIVTLNVSGRHGETQWCLALLRNRRQQGFGQGKLTVQCPLTGKAKEPSAQRQVLWERILDYFQQSGRFAGGLDFHLVVTVAPRDRRIICRFQKCERQECFQSGSSF